MRISKKEIAIIALILVMSFLIYARFSTDIIYLDAVSEYYPAVRLIEDNSLNMWDSYNDKYETYYFKLPFTDEVISSYGESYPAQSSYLIFLIAYVMSLFGKGSIQYISPMISVISLFFIFLISRELVVKKYLSFLPVILISFFPLFIIWSIIHQSVIFQVLFFSISVYFLIKIYNEQGYYYLFLAGFFFVCLVLLKPTYIALFPVFLIACYPKIKIKPKKAIIILLLPVVLLGFWFFASNLSYFGDPFFVGYLHSDYHPVSKIISDSPFDSRLSQIVSLNPIIFFDSILYFFKGLYGYSFLFFLLLCIIPLAIFTNKKGRSYSILFLAALFLLILFNSGIRESLWGSWKTDLPFNLILAFFRYLLPVILLIPVFAIFSVEKGVGRINKRVLLILVFMFVIFNTFSLLSTINYKGGASLGWYEEFTNNLEVYSGDAKSYIPKNAVILYPERFELYYFSNNLNRYRFFHYDGIPPSYRLSETNRIVDEMLTNGERVYVGVYSEPYRSTILNKEEGDPNIGEVLDNLSENFILEKVNGTEFNRMKFYFAEVKRK